MKIVTVYIQKGARVGDTRPIQTPKGKVHGRVVQDLAGSMGEHRLHGSDKPYDPAWHYYKVEIPDD